MISVGIAQIVTILELIFRTQKITIMMTIASPADDSLQTIEASQVEQKVIKIDKCIRFVYYGAVVLICITFVCFVSITYAIQEEYEHDSKKSSQEKYRKIEEAQLPFGALTNILATVVLIAAVARLVYLLMKYFKDSMKKEIYLCIFIQAVFCFGFTVRCILESLLWEKMDDLK